MEIKTYDGKFFEIDSIPSEKDLEKIRSIHKNRYREIYTVCGDRAKIDFLVKCNEHGWFSITKKAFKNGSNCKLCAKKIKNKKIKETLIQKREGRGGFVLEKKCVICGNIFYTENTKKQSKRVTCSQKCRKEKCRLNCLIQNQDPEFNKRKSLRMKKEFFEGKREQTKSYADWIKYKDFKVQGKFEYEMCVALDKLLSYGKIHSWEYTNDRIQYNKPNSGVCSYLLDFKVYLTENIFFYIETKGFSVDTDLFKWVAVLKKGLSLKVFFQREHLKLIQKNPEFILLHNYLEDTNKYIYDYKNNFKKFKPYREAQ